MRTIVALALLLSACGEGAPCKQIVIVPVEHCFWYGDRYVRNPSPDAGAPHGNFETCTEALTCGD